MQISRNKVATFDFTVTDESGLMLDSSKKSGLLSYIHGIGSLIPGLESAMEGKSAGDSFSVSVLPAQGYGERDESLLQVIPRSVFKEIEDLEVGIEVRIEDENGVRLAAVSKIDDDNVTLDGNHPLAGITLNFDVDIVDVRNATKEELEHGCVGGRNDCGCHDACCG